ncbi:Long-chain-fatty-acid--CoA ligase [Rhodococcus sp. B50]|nr:Long-chain-fatty-acid--CoA ligase [Rhodococcus sp. B50]
MVNRMDAAISPWTKHYPASVSPDLTGSFPTMLDAWNEHAAGRPHDPAVHYFDATLSFADIDGAADALAAALHDKGVTAGDRVAIYLQNDPQWLVALLAAWKLRAVPVAVNPMLRAGELLHILTDSGAVALICLDELYESVVADIRPRTPLHTVVTTHPLDMTPNATMPAAIEPHVPPRKVFADTSDWRSSMAEYRDRRPTPTECSSSDIASLTYTSGTTGRSKGAMNLHSAMVHSSTVYTRWWDLRPERDVIIGLAPVFHITGLVAGFGVHIVSGAPLVLLHRFDAEATLRAVERRRGTFMIGASTAFIALTNHPCLREVDVSSLTKTPSGGAPVSQALVDRIRAASGWTLRGAYGMTETTSPTHLGPPDIDPPTDPESGALSVGVPVPGAQIRIVDPVDGRDVDPGEAGEIVVAGPMVVPGYWQLPEESAHAIRDGWLHTGDLGKMTEDGWLFVVDRIKDLINAGGYKVVPRDVEDVLYQHPAVREASVVGVPDEYRGETVRAFVSLVPGATAREEELIAFCRDRMAAYKYPRSVVVLDELPKNASGKLLRRELRNG